jgi:hypothetical protein
MRARGRGSYNDAKGSDEAEEWFSVGLAKSGKHDGNTDVEPLLWNPYGRWRRGFAPRALCVIP